MPRRSNARDLQSLLVKLVRRDPRWLIVLLMIAGVVFLIDRFQHASKRRMPIPPASTEGYLFCSWNVENLFDDVDDPRNLDPLDSWFARDSRALRQKLDLLADSLLELNEGRGPDILALVEVENRRAVELLQETLNRRLSTEWHYTEIAHHDNLSGRRIEPAILTRLPLESSGMRTYSAGRRLLGARVEIDGHPLDVLVGHWTSRLTDEDGSKRLAYAQEMYATYQKIERSNNDLADVLICGDFNDEPDDEAIRLGLRATGDQSAVVASAGTNQPRLLNLMAGRDPEQFGTYLYRNRWQILDHLVISAGLLDDQGWSLVVDTVQTVNGPSLQDRRGGPLRFGNETKVNRRGPSDHFAVCVRLHPPKTQEQAVEGAQDLAMTPSLIPLH
ncbi:endonuclease/exonuclease/phosphatase family protein [Tautonia rosea]|uniref:endonuclease/exonuclease/phosphatase family protein n=1 Tax=Tautonia rosea TaxID=2728037 RepID=UPI00147591EC|nr:endonuclease/exonuclease/phosphatase family protein [Tautonia rosea]